MASHRKDIFCLLLVAKIAKSLREAGRENPRWNARKNSAIHHLSLQNYRKPSKIVFLSHVSPVHCATAMIALTYLEFYSGIGGWGYALEHALRNVASSSPEPKLLGAYDHSDLCKNVFNHNHQNKKLFRQTPIERITREQLETHAAHIWCMSPVSGHTILSFL